MLTAEEYSLAQAALATAETQKASLDQLRRDCIEKAREYNDQTRQCTNKITAIERDIAPVRLQVAEYNADQKQQLVERLKAERVAQEQAAAEAKAKEQSELAKAQARIKELESVVAKG